EQRRALELVRTSSEALLTILNDILDYSKIEAEHLELEAIPFDLPKVVHATATLLAVRAREKHLELTVDVLPDVPQMVRGDPTRVRQVLMNLIGNAIKFTDQGEVDVSASVARRDGGPRGAPRRCRSRGAAPRRARGGALRPRDPRRPDARPGRLRARHRRPRRSRAGGDAAPDPHLGGAARRRRAVPAAGYPGVSH